MGQMVQITDSRGFGLNENCKAAKGKKHGGLCSWERKGIGDVNADVGRQIILGKVLFNQGQFGKIW